MLAALPPALQPPISYFMPVHSLDLKRFLPHGNLLLILR